MAWWLAYEELYGDMDKEYPIMSEKFKDDIVILGGDEDIVSADRSQTGNFMAADTVSFDWGSGQDHISFGTASADTLNIGTPIPGGMGEDHISFSGAAGTAYHYDFGDDPYPTLGAVNDVYAYHFPPTDTKPKPNLKEGSNQKYQEDKGIADLKSYVASTYQGHYTNKNSDVQTLDLIHSVGDAESFCRSNALKYLSRYDKKGSAKNDILKAMHYCLLLYYFSGNTQEPDYTNTRYETF